MQMSWYDKNELLAEVDLAKVYPSLGLGWFSFFFFPDQWIWEKSSISKDGTLGCRCEIEFITTQATPSSPNNDIRALNFNKFFGRFIFKTNPTVVNALNFRLPIREGRWV